MILRLRKFEDEVMVEDFKDYTVEELAEDIATNYEGDLTYFSESGFAVVSTYGCFLNIVSDPRLLPLLQPMVARKQRELGI